MKLSAIARIATVLLSLACRALAQEQPKKAAPYEKIEAAGLHNVFAVEGRIISGSSPHDDEGFAALAKLGVKTILSVDGAIPDVGAAARHGLRYVHIPFGYDGIESSNALRIVKAVSSLPGPIYIHCHHGKHRGPAAIGVACRGLYGWDATLGDKWLKAAGTATNYAGLYKSVEIFVAPTPSELETISGYFPPKAPVADLVDMMVRTDEHVESLKAIRDPGFRSPPKKPDLVPVNEALQLLELFREAGRNKTDAHRGENFLSEMSRAESAAHSLHTALKKLAAERTPETEAGAEAAFTSVTKSCTSCHRAFRD